MFVSSGMRAINSIPPLEEIVYASTYGVVMDDSTNNDTALASLKAYLQSDTSKLYHVIFDTGTCQYDNNRWLFGINKVIIDGGDSGCTFKCIHPGPFEANGRPLNFNDHFSDRGDQQVTGINQSPIMGDKFETVSSGGYTITTTVEGDAADYSNGEHVLLHGYDQQYTGWPPNPRYFEYKIVESVGTGTVTFTEAIQHYYDSRWTDYDAGTGDFGKPRILSLNRTNYNIPEYIKFKNVSFVANPITGFDSIQAPALESVYENVGGDTFSPSMCNSIDMYNLTVNSHIEVDKVVGSITIKNTTATSSTRTIIGESTGVNNLTIQDNILTGEVTSRSRYVNLLNSTFHSKSDSQYGIYKHNGGWPITEFHVENCHWVDETSSVLLHAINNGVLSSLTVADVGAGDEIKLVWDSTETPYTGTKGILNYIDYGYVLTRNPAGISGTVTGIYWDGDDPGYIYLEGTWATPTTSEVYQFRPILRQYDDGGNTIEGDCSTIWRNAAWLEA